MHCGMHGERHIVVDMTEMSATPIDEITTEHEMGYLYAEVHDSGIEVDAHTDGTLSVDWSTTGDGVTILDIDEATELMLMLAAAITAARKA